MTEAQGEIIIELLTKISGQLAKLQKTPERSADPKSRDDQRAALAVVAIARGASTFQEIANQLGVSRGTVSRNPGIRRAMEAAIRDRSVCRESAEEFRFANH